MNKTIHEKSFEIFLQVQVFEYLKQFFFISNYCHFLIQIKKIIQNI